ncbi:MAG: acetyl-CoA carboxylase biotin carboxyl carrier protein [Burkholderiales bacterium]|nr:acetyl-CoA carboxylase biotin carboxyl carrier protein [Burkholderiales bacterium]MBS0413541.1 acetyl-CoA carboxylase biotin carboxyl carrier protein [Pseudomonadota bacterium]
MNNIDLEELAMVVRLLKEAEFSEFSYSKGDVSLVVRRGDLVDLGATQDTSKLAYLSTRHISEKSRPEVREPVRDQATARTVPAKSPDEIEGIKIRSPLLGTFYVTPKPGEPPFVKVGDRVEPETVVCIIEVMKLMNSVTAGASGIVAAIHVANGELVEQDQPLFTLTEAS